MSGENRGILRWMISGKPGLVVIELRICSKI